MENKPAIGEGALNKVKSKSKARWEILRNAIVDKRLVGSGDITFIQSVRRFNTFELFTRKQCTCVLKPDKRSANKKKPQCSWFSYICEDIPFSKEVWIQHLFSDVNLKDILSFNNTGNVCIWPAEEVLAYYCILHIDKFHFKSVIELGGGSSSLAGICIALNAKSPKQILLTDGNKRCVESLEKTIEMNLKNKKNINISASSLLWDDVGTYQQHKNAFDFVICADCLFFDKYRQSLAETIHYVLKSSGKALIFAPRRGHTLAQFVDISSKIFSSVTESDHYCPAIINKHETEQLHNDSYDPEIHFPVLVELIK
ncbi:calmodulin-lysine N-methyltransferase-like isoform X2 [Clavelina lepadiformis]